MLEQEPSDHFGLRLRTMLARTGGGAPYTNSVPLM
jgi:hypothetical protein